MNQNKRVLEERRFVENGEDLSAGESEHQVPIDLAYRNSRLIVDPVGIVPGCTYGVSLSLY